MAGRWQSYPILNTWGVEIGSESEKHPNNSQRKPCVEDSQAIKMAELSKTHPTGLPAPRGTTKVDQILQPR